MEIILLGTGAAWPDAYRCAPAFLLKFNNTPFLIDCGGGTNHQLMKAECPPSQIKHIFFTHMHIDHCVEFPSLVFGAYLTGKKDGFDVYGPQGTKHFTKSIFDDTYDFAQPMMKRLRNKDIEINAKEVEQGTFFEDSGVSVEAIPVKHGIPSLAFKFTAGEKSVVFSGDTAPCENIIEISKNADLLIIECSFPEEVGSKPGHCIPSEVADIALKANVRKLILTHLFPNCRGKEQEMINTVKKSFSGPVQIGSDLDLIEL